MLLTITLVISGLVLFNLLLLKYSINDIERSSKSSKNKPVVLKPEVEVKPIKPIAQTLAPTGS
ncbi:hypothetical protein [Cognatitamlana onchidii]|uniref:hypothetical protein n=1 Tax=Cognatitamlana onchidii TaxID=2562860 RepID=UPI0010A630C2|nr:hypothetical protein [Algibacter onchidii]